MTEKSISIIFGAPLAVVAFFIGNLDGLIIALMALVVIDFVSGIIKGIHDKNLDSKVMFKGGIKKVGIFLIVAVANIIDNVLNLNGAIRSMAIGYYLANEALSITENWGKLGLGYPQKMINVLKQLRDDNEDDRK